MARRVGDRITPKQAGVGRKKPNLAPFRPRVEHVPSKRPNRQPQFGPSRARVRAERRRRPRRRDTGLGPFGPAPGIPSGLTAPVTPQETRAQIRLRRAQRELAEILLPPGRGRPEGARAEPRREGAIPGYGPPSDAGEYAVRDLQQAGILPKRKRLGQDIAEIVAAIGLLAVPGGFPSRVPGALKAARAVRAGRAAPAVRTAPRAGRLSRAARGVAERTPRPVREIPGTARTARQLLRQNRALRRKALPLASRAGAAHTPVAGQTSAIFEGTRRALEEDAETVLRRTPSAALASLAGLGTTLAAPVTAAIQRDVRPLKQAAEMQGLAARDFARFLSGDPEAVKELTKEYGLSMHAALGLPVLARGVRPVKRLRKLGQATRRKSRVSQARMGRTREEGPPPLLRMTERRRTRERVAGMRTTAESRLEARVPGHIEPYVKALRKVPEEHRHVVPLLATGRISRTNPERGLAQARRIRERLEKLPRRLQVERGEGVLDDYAAARYITEHPNVLRDPAVWRAVDERGRRAGERRPTTIAEERARLATQEGQAIEYGVPQPTQRVAREAGAQMKGARKAKAEAKRLRRSATAAETRASERRRGLLESVRVEERLRGGEARRQRRLADLAERDVRGRKFDDALASAFELGRRTRITDDPFDDRERFIEGLSGAKSVAKRTAEKKRRYSPRSRQSLYARDSTRGGRHEQLRGELEGRLEKGDLSPEVRAFAWFEARSFLAREGGERPAELADLFERLERGDSSPEVQEFAYHLAREYYKTPPSDLGTPFDLEPSAPPRPAPKVQRPSTGRLDAATERLLERLQRAAKERERAHAVLALRPPARVVRRSQEIDALRTGAVGRRRRADVLEGQAEAQAKEGKRLGALTKKARRKEAPPAVFGTADWQRAVAAFDDEMLTLRKQQELPEPQYRKAMDTARLLEDEGVLKPGHRPLARGREPRSTGLVIRKGTADTRWEADVAESLVRPLRVDEGNRLIRDFFDSERLRVGGRDVFDTAEQAAQGISRFGRERRGKRPQVIAVRWSEFERAFDGDTVLTALDEALERKGGGEGPFALFDREAVIELRHQLRQQSRIFEGALRFNRVQAWAVLGTSPGWLLSQFPATLAPALLTVGPARLIQGAWRYHRAPDDEKVAYASLAEAPHGLGMVATDSVHGLRRGMVEMEYKSIRMMGRGRMRRTFPQIPHIIRHVERAYTMKIRQYAAAGQLAKERARILRGVRAAAERLAKNADGFYVEAQEALTKMRDLPYEDQVRWMVDNPKVAGRIQGYLREMLGDWRTLTRFEEPAAALGFFYSYLRWSMRFTWRHFPQRHPIRAAILMYLGYANTREIKRLLGFYPDWTSTLMSLVLYTGRRPSEAKLLAAARFSPGSNALVEAGMEGFDEDALRLMQPAVGAIADAFYGYDSTRDRPLADEETTFNPFTGERLRITESGETTNQPAFMVKAGLALNELLRLAVPTRLSFPDLLLEDQGGPHKNTLWNKLLPTGGERTRSALLGTQLVSVRRAATLEKLRRYTDYRAAWLNENIPERSRYRKMPPGPEKDRLRKRLTHKIERAEWADTQIGRLEASHRRTDPTLESLRLSSKARKSFFAPLGGRGRSKSAWDATSKGRSAWEPSGRSSSAWTPTR